MIAVIKTAELTPQTTSQVYCYSVDQSLAIIFCETPPQNAIDFFDYDNISAVLQTPAWKQPQDGE